MTHVSGVLGQKLGMTIVSTEVDDRLNVLMRLVTKDLSDP